MGNIALWVHWNSVHGVCIQLWYTIEAIHLLYLLYPSLQGFRGTFQPSNISCSLYCWEADEESSRFPLHFPSLSFGRICRLWYQLSPSEELCHLFNNEFRLLVGAPNRFPLLLWRSAGCVLGPPDLARGATDFCVHPCLFGAQVWCCPQQDRSHPQGSMPLLYSLSLSVHDKELWRVSQPGNWTRSVYLYAWIIASWIRCRIQCKVHVGLYFDAFPRCHTRRLPLLLPCISWGLR